MSHKLKMVSLKLLWLAFVVTNLSRCRGQDDSEDIAEVDVVVDAADASDAAKGGTIHDLFSSEESG